MSSGLIWPFILLQVATVVAIIMFLRVLLHKQLEIGLRRITKLDQENVRKEAELNERAKALEAECGTKIAAAEKEAGNILAAAKEEAKKAREAERLKTKEEAKRMIQGAQKEREKSLKESRHEIFTKALEISEKILKRVFSDEELKGFRAKITKDVIAYIMNSEEITGLLDAGAKIEVITHGPLASDDKRSITKMLEEKKGAKLDVRFTEDKDAIGGLVLKIGERIIDGGLTYRLAKAAQELRENNGG